MAYAFSEYALLFRALSDETRIQIFSMLDVEQERCACDLLEKLNITQPTLSYHMKILTQVELIHARKDGAWMRYKRNPKRVAQLEEFLKEVGSAL